MKKIALVLLLFFFLGSSFVYAQQKTVAAPKAVVGEYVLPQPAATEGGATFLGTLFKFAFSLVVIIVLVYVTVYVLKVVTARYKPTSILEGSMFNLLDSFCVGPNKNIYLVGINGKRILVLCVTDKEVTVLDKIENSDEAGEIFAKTKERLTTVRSFKDHFKSAQKKKAAQEYIKNYLNSLTSVFSGMKKDRS